MSGVSILLRYISLELISAISQGQPLFSVFGLYFNPSSFWQQVISWTSPWSQYYGFTLTYPVLGSKSFLWASPCSQYHGVMNSGLYFNPSCFWQRVISLDQPLFSILGLYFNPSYFGSRSFLSPITMTTEANMRDRQSVWALNIMTSAKWNTSQILHPSLYAPLTLFI